MRLAFSPPPEKPTWTGPKEADKEAYALYKTEYYRRLRQFDPDKLKNRHKERMATDPEYRKAKEASRKKAKEKHKKSNPAPVKTPKPPKVILTEEEKKVRRKEYSRKAYLKDIVKSKEQRKNWHKNNKEKANQSCRDRMTRIKNDPVLLMEHQKKEKERYPKKYERTKERMKTDPQFRLRVRCGERIKRALKSRSWRPKTMSLIGCSLQTLRSHLESQFLDGMTWENWALDGWHIDHIKPLSSFNLHDDEELKKACHYTNLQPLWAFDNLSKGGKLDYRPPNNQRSP